MKRIRNPSKISRIERFYSNQLRQVADAVGQIISSSVTDDPASALSSIPLLESYSSVIEEWALMTAGQMLSEARKEEEKTWFRVARDLGESISKEIRNAPTGEIYHQLLREQVDLIQSLPTQAAERVHELATESLTTGRRASEIITDIRQMGDVTAARAMTIARTETHRASTTLLQARAVYIGSPGYIWQTVGDSDVRKDHDDLNGHFFEWSNPPIADKRTEARAHPGCIYNCRCFPLPQLPKRYF